MILLTKDYRIYHQIIFSQDPHTSSWGSWVVLVFWVKQYTSIPYGVHPVLWQFHLKILIVISQFVTSNMSLQHTKLFGFCLQSILLSPQIFHFFFLAWYLALVSSCKYKLCDRGNSNITNLLTYSFFKCLSQFLQFSLLIFVKLFYHPIKGDLV